MPLLSYNEVLYVLTSISGFSVLFLSCLFTHTTVHIMYFSFVWFWPHLIGCSPWGLEESDTTERLHFHFSLSCIGEGNGNPLQCSCLENPRDGGAWWAAVYGVTQCVPSSVSSFANSEGTPSLLVSFLVLLTTSPEQGVLLGVEISEGEKSWLFQWRLKLKNDKPV